MPTPLIKQLTEAALEVVIESHPADELVPNLGMERQEYTVKNPSSEFKLETPHKGLRNASKKWTMPIRRWGMILSRPLIYFEGRLDGVLKL